jgi:hypothetical protein
MTTAVTPGWWAEPTISRRIRRVRAWTGRCSGRPASSDIGACIAVGGMLHLVSQSRKRPKIDEERLQLVWETHRLLVAWLSLDVGDNDPARFAATRDRVRAGIGDRADRLLGPPPPQSFEVLMTALINELAAQPGDDEVLIVLDDYQARRPAGAHVGDVPV